MSARWFCVSLASLLLATAAGAAEPEPTPSPSGGLSPAADGVSAEEPLPESERPTLIVLDLVAERQMEESLMRLLNELLLTEFARSDKYKVLGTSDIKAMINHEIERTMTGCQEVACMAEIGGMLGADYLGFANIGRVGDYYLLNVKVIDVVRSSVVDRWSTQVEGIENKLMNAVRVSVAAVTGRPLPPGVMVEDAEGGVGLLPIVLAGAGGLLLANGVVFGIITKSHHDIAEDPDAFGRQVAAESGATTQTVANVSYGLGLASLAAAAVVWYLFDDAPQSTVAVQPTPEGDGAIAVGTFPF